MSHTIEFTPEQAEAWDDFQRTVPRQYARVGDRLADLFVLDLLFQRHTGRGLVEQADRCRAELDDELASAIEAEFGDGETVQKFTGIAPDERK